jgi:predicted lipid-binding transport protein (Tim44 family)
MFRAVLIALPLLVAPVALPLPAAAAASVAAEQSRTGENCDEQNQRSRRRGRGIGGMFGSIVGGRLGGLGGVVSSVLPVGELLGEAIASLLDCREQQQAAGATEQAVRGGVGTTAAWQSETRSNVTGSSTVVAADSSTVEGQCMTVTDIVIIDGQETRAPKRMCRRPPNNRYVRV